MSPAPAPVMIGVLALQGGFSEHVASLNSLNLPISVHAIRTPEQLALVSALVIPGGESTTISICAAQSGLLEPLREFVKEAKGGRKSVWGTCAGMILLGDEVVGSKEGYTGLGGVGMKVVRNQWGRQAESFEHGLDIPCISNASKPYPAVFIRAPVVHTVLPSPSPNSIPFTVLSKVPREILPIPKATVSAFDGAVIQPTELGPDADIVMARQGGLLVTSFHPELTDDNRVHEWWVKEMVVKELGLAL